MRALEFITGHVTFKLHYDQIYQMKTTNVFLCAIGSILVTFFLLFSNVLPTNSIVVYLYFFQVFQCLFSWYLVHQIEVELLPVYD